MKNIKLPLVAAIVAIAITTTMDFTGYLVFSALPLMGVTLVFWLIQRQTKTEVGLVLGSLRDYGLALSYPAVVLGLAVLVAYIAGVLSTAGTSSQWRLLSAAARQGQEVREPPRSRVALDEAAAASMSL